MIVYHAMAIANGRVVYADKDGKPCDWDTAARGLYDAISDLALKASKASGLSFKLYR